MYLHNVLVDDDRISAVLDWKSALFGAPEHEFARVRPYLGARVDWASFVAVYHRNGGRELREQDLGFYTAFNLMRILILAQQALAAVIDGRSRDFRMIKLNLTYLPIFMSLAGAAAVWDLPLEADPREPVA